MKYHKLFVTPMPHSQMQEYDIAEMEIIKTNSKALIREPCIPYRAFGPIVPEFELARKRVRKTRPRDGPEGRARPRRAGCDWTVEMWLN